MAGSEHPPPPIPPGHEERNPDVLPEQTLQQSSTSTHPQGQAGQTVNPAVQFEPPPRLNPDHDDVSSPIHFTRDPHKLIGYLVPFPKPNLHNIPAERVPSRFLIYTPPPPPLSKPAEGEKESKVHKLQRKWQEELREAKTSQAKTASWKGIKGKATKGINWGMGQTKTASLEFLTRINLSPKEKDEQAAHDRHADDGHDEGHETARTVGLEELRLLYAPSGALPGDAAALRREFVDTMLRAQSQAQRDAVVATGLLPVGAAIDVLATLVWPFGGLLEIDAVWLTASIRGAKTSRSVTKRLTSTTTTTHSGGGGGGGDKSEGTLQLNFEPSPRLRVLERYLAAECHARDPARFPSAGGAQPTESEVLEAIGWTPSTAGAEERNWEDEQWEIAEVKDDLRNVMHKGAKEWDKWCKLFEKTPEKAMKK